jgi:hypothetical protein
VSDLPRRLRAQAEQCDLHGSPLTARILFGAADDFEAGGPTADLLRPHADDPSGSVPSLRLAGALHRLVLERQAPELALHYPSVGGTAGVDGAWPVARETIRTHLDQLRVAVRRPVQTNEVGRSAVLYGGLLHVAARTGLPVRLLEIGASAGLNLLVDRFAYDVADGLLLGDPAGPVRLHRPWQGALPSGTVEIVDRAGCDPAPLDARSAEDRLTLTSYVWPDQVERLERLRAALHLAADAGVHVERLAGSDFLARELATPRDGVATVVWHSVVRQYMAPEERSRVQHLLREAGARATADAPLAHLFLEPERVGGGDFRFVIGLTLWPGPQSVTLGEARGHGPPVVWS